MKFEFTKDIKLIHECLTSDHVWRMGTDDKLSLMSKLMFFVPLDKFLWVKVDDYGIFMLERYSDDTCRVHIALRKNAVGKSEEIGREGIKWLLANTSYKSIEALIPECNQHAVRLAKATGMEFIKNLRKSFMKYGELHDQYLFRIGG